jgi:hypothetical protein
VLEVHAQVGASGLGGLGDVVGLSAASRRSKQGQANKTSCPS